MKSLRQQFGDDFAGSAFQTTDGDQNIVGKWGRICQLDDGTYDCWFVGPGLAPLGARKIGAIEKKCRLNDGFVKLTGEAYTQGRGRDFVLRMAPLVGVKMKRKLSPAVRENLAKNLARARRKQHRADLRLVAG